MNPPTSANPISLVGVFPPIPTPFNPDGDLDLDHLRNNLDRWNGQPFSGYVVGGSNGEFVSLTLDERVEVVQETRFTIPSDRLLIAGSGMESTRATIELTLQMAEVGADAVIVVTPSYYKRLMSAAALENHYRQVADISPVPVILYSVPANTGVDLQLEAVVRLANHPNVVGIKDSGGSVAKIGAMVHDTPDDFQVLAGSAGFLLGALAVGAVGTIAALANIAGSELVEILTQFRSGNLTLAQEMQQQLIEVNTAVTTRFGVPGLKSALDMMGYYGGPVRSPLLPLSDEDRGMLRWVLEKAGLI
jgi:4-hydroxy-2-oxoglutarate aldolase